MSIEYRDAQEADILSIQQAALESWHTTYRDIFSAEFIANFVARGYSTDGLRDSIYQPGAIFLVAVDDKRVVGFCNLGDRGDGLELFRIYVVPEHWRGGIGGKLLDILESRLVGRGAGEYYCFVHSRNEVGKSFYVRRGFDHDPARDKEDEWCMVKKLASPE